jgi:DNA-3-methyladenine glycosylase
MLPPKRIPRDFFRRRTLDVARGILGQRLVRIEHDKTRTSGWIIEAEAYIGTEDLGCHARTGRTDRNQSMWGPPGHAYVYFTYGMHWMLNIVTELEGFPAAVLLRALHPLENLARMRDRRAGQPEKHLTDGPAKLCQALDIDKDFDGHDVCRPSSTLFLEQGVPMDESFVTNGPRVGLNNVPQPWKSVPWRFRISPEGVGKLAKEENR